MPKASSYSITAMTAPSPKTCTRSATSPSRRVTRGLAVGDFDNDGDRDVLMVSQTGPLQLFRNDGGNQNHWLTLQARRRRRQPGRAGREGDAPHGLGKQTQWVHGSSSYCSHSDTRLTFGLGEAAGVLSGEVRWPGSGGQPGKTQTFGPLAAGAFYWLKRGSHLSKTRGSKNAKSQTKKLSAVLERRKQTWERALKQLLKLGLRPRPERQAVSTNSRGRLNCKAWAAPVSRRNSPRGRAAASRRATASGIMPSCSPRTIRQGARTSSACAAARLPASCGSSPGNAECPSARTSGPARNYSSAAPECRPAAGPAAYRQKEMYCSPDRRPHQHQPPYPLRMTPRQRQRHLTAHRISRQMGAIQVQRVHQPHRPIRQILHAHRFFRSRRAAEARHIRHEDRAAQMPLREDFQGGSPGFGGATQAMQQDDREMHGDGKAGLGQESST